VGQLLEKIAFTAATAPAKPAPTKGFSERDLFAAVYEDPDDDGPRALLADVLQERGDPRGQFIALQLAPNQNETLAEQLKLVRKHQRAWLGELSSHLGSPLPLRG
jgi:uncharacterized protein (TIGR02996 family)